MAGNDDLGPWGEQSRRNVLKGVAGGVLGGSVLQRASDLAAAAPTSSSTGETQYLGTTGPAAVYSRDGGWNQLGDDIDTDPASVTDIVRFEGTLYAAVTTDKILDRGDGQVWRYEDDTWQQDGDDLQNEVTKLIVYDGDLYAGTASESAKLYRRDGSSSWTEVVNESEWKGFGAAHVFDDDLYLTGSSFARFGRYDGSSFIEEEDYSGPCVFDLAEHDGDLFAGSHNALLFKRNKGSWSIVHGIGGKPAHSFDDSYNLLQLAVYDGTLYVGGQEGKLYKWTGSDLEELHEFDDSVVAMESTADGLLIGTGVNAAECTGSQEDGTATVSKYDGESVSPISKNAQFGDAVQAITAVENSSRLVRTEYPSVALEPDDSPTFTATIEPGDDPTLTATTEPDENQESPSIDVEGGMLLTDPEDESQQPEFADLDDTSTTVDDDGNIVVEATLPVPEDVLDEPIFGYGIEHSLEISVGEEQVLDIGSDGAPTPHSYVFETVDRVACITAKSNRDLSEFKTTDSDPGLFDFMRSKAEYLNRFWASGLGNMGAKGFDIEFVTDVRNPPLDVRKGWLELPNSWSYYESSDDPATDFMDEALARAHENLDIDWSEYETTMVVNELNDGNRLSDPFWMGRLPPNLEVDFDLLNIEFDTDDWDLPIQPRDLPDSASVDKIDSMHVVRTGDAWRHEFGHATGPGNQIGFPEMYNIDGFDSAIANFGVIGDWGIMDDGDVLCGFIRSAVGESITGLSPDSWLDINSSVHIVDDTSVTTDEPLTEKDLGDDLNWLFSAWANVSVTVDIDTPSWGSWDGDWIEGDADISVDVEAAEPKLGIYILEERSGRQTNIGLPSEGSSERFYTSPGNHDHGIALYRFDTLEFDDLSTLDNITDRDEEVTVSLRPESLELEYLPPYGDKSDVSDFYTSTEITLSDNTRSEYADPPSGATFTLDRAPSETSRDPKVTAKRDVADLIENIDGVAERAVSIVVDHVSNFLEEAIQHSDEGVPGPEVLVETSDGRRVGVDPETGELVNEIDGAIVTGQPNNPRITVPGSEDITVSVTATHFREYLRERDIEPPEYIPYERTVIVDDSPEVEERHGYAFIEGRTTHRTLGAIGPAGDDDDDDDDDIPAVTNAPIEVNPPQISANSNGRWVTTWIGLPEETSVDALLLEAVTLGSVSAVSDEQYGFVKNPDTETRDGKLFVKVKFSRQDLVDELGTGSHSVALSGVVGNTSFYGSADIDVTDPGGNDDSDGNNGNDDSGGNNGNGNSDGNNGNGNSGGNNGNGNSGGNNGNGNSGRNNK